MTGDFTRDIAFMLAALVFGLGLIIWHLGTKENSSRLNLAGGFLTIVAVLAMLCTVYHYISSWNKGMHMYPGQNSGHMINQGIAEGQMGMMNGQEMHNMMMKNINTCLSQMKGLMMDDEGMQKMRYCMMGTK